MRFARLAFALGALVVALTLSLLGCSDAPPGEPSASSGSELTPFLFTNDKAACQYFVAKGLTSFQAAGIVGNLDQESGVDPNAIQYGGGPGRGIAQWSVGGRWDTDANDNAVAYASQQGQSVWSLQLQLDFIWYELTTFSSYGLSRLRGTTNITDATVVFETDFEGCGTCDESQRIAYAQQVLSSCDVPYAAQFVSQSFPYASTTMTMTEGQVIPSYIELKNVGSKAWDSNTRLGTTMARDRKSAFADGTWLSPNRLAAVSGTVPPGGTYKFQFDLAAPNKTGTYDEFFGVVQEGTAWFSDSGQGGPPDDQLEVKIAVVAPPPGTTPPDAGAPEDDGGSIGAGGSQADGGSIDDDAGSAIPTPIASGPSAAIDGGASGAVDMADVGSNGGCAVSSARGEPPSWAIVVGAVAWLARRRRRRAC